VAPNPTPRAAGRPSPRPTPAQTILYHACPECRAATVDTEDGLISISPHRIIELAPHSNVIEILPEEEQDVEVLPAGRTDAPNSASLSRKVLNRDSGRCGNPACENRLRLHAHHIVFRSAGGPTALANEVALCDTCHAMVHAGLLEVRGSPYTGLSWTPRPFSPAAKLRDASAACARARDLIVALPYFTAAERRELPEADAPSPRHHDAVASAEASQAVDPRTDLPQMPEPVDARTKVREVSQPVDTRVQPRRGPAGSSRLARRH
jgi:hypothetical protein